VAAVLDDGTIAVEEYSWVVCHFRTLFYKQAELSKYTRLREFNQSNKVFEFCKFNYMFPGLCLRRVMVWRIFSFSQGSISVNTIICKVNILQFSEGALCYYGE
jgi:hypothetical protein